MIEAYKKFWSNYANFNGRTSRADYWWTFLANILVGMIIGFVCGFISGLTGDSNGEVSLGISTLLPSLYSLAIFVPSLAIAVRRLHDINKSGWYLLMGLIPFVGGIILLVYYLSDSVNTNNQYGQQV